MTNHIALPKLVKPAKYLLIPFVGLIILLGAISIRVQGASGPDDVAAQQIIARINQWRLQEGLSPLKVNATLRTMALDQASYLASLSVLPEGEDGGDIHIDKNGLKPPQRAIKDPYNWPTYGRPDRAAIGENAAVGNMDFAMLFWSKSDIHRKTALNPAYREVGAAAIKYKNGYLFIVDFGSRPNVLPAFYSPSDNALILTNEQYRWKNGGTWIQSAQQIQFLNAKDTPFHAEPELWQQKLVINKDWGAAFKIRYIDGKTNAIVPVDEAADLVVLPDTLAAVAAAAAAGAASPQPTAAPADTAQPTAQPTQAPSQPTAAPTTQPATEGTAQPANPPAATEVPTSQPTAAAPAAAESGLVVYYDAVSLTLVNTSKKPINIAAINFKYGDKYLGTERWNKTYPVPLDTFPGGQCLQVLGVAEKPLKPVLCTSVRGILQFPADRLFWTQGDFTVLVGSNAVATCKKDDNSCNIPLP